MQSHKPHRRVVVASLLAAVLVASLVVAGPLDPPAGPITGTYKTLTEVEPRTPLAQSQVPITISQPGSYYLTGNLFAPQLVAAIITVNAPGVTLDLNGFQIDGATDVGEATNAIKINAVGAGCRVLHGSVIDATGNGVQCDAPDCSFTDVRIAQCALDGLNVGAEVLVERCTFTENGGDGLDGGSTIRSVVRACMAKGNGGTGFEINGAVENCVAGNNGGPGFNGGGTFTRCDSSQNDSDGMSIFGGIVSECSAGANGGCGIRIGNNVTVTGCNSRVNSGPGIIMSWRGVALNNNCAENGGTFPHTQSNIVVEGNNNRVEGNTCTDALRGIEVTGTGNLIIRNTCAANTTNWSIVANNKVGPIVAAPNSVAISGDTGGAGVGSTNAWANITY